MIKDAKSEWIRKAVYQLESKVVFPLRFKKICSNELAIPSNHSVLLLQNHFSWWDGFWGLYLSYQYFQKKYHVMVQEDQMIKNRSLKYMGAFSVRKNSREVLESIEYASQLLSNSNNLVQLFPQGRLQSLYTSDIEIERGVLKLIDHIKSPCQVIYNAVTINYLESFKPTITFNLLNLGSCNSVDIPTLQESISSHHQKAMVRSIRV